MASFSPSLGWSGPSLGWSSPSKGRGGPSLGRAFIPLIRFVSTGGDG
jgi:hypothetical protein